MFPLILLPCCILLLLHCPIFQVPNGFCRVRINSLPGQSQNTAGWSVQGKDLCLLGQRDSCPSPRRVLLCRAGDLQPPPKQKERPKWKREQQHQGKSTLKPLIYKALLEVQNIRDSSCCYYYWKKLQENGTMKAMMSFHDKKQFRVAKKTPLLAWYKILWFLFHLKMCFSVSQGVFFTGQQRKFLWALLIFAEDICAPIMK